MQLVKVEIAVVGLLGGRVFVGQENLDAVRGIPRAFSANCVARKNSGNQHLLVASSSIETYTQMV